MIAIQLAEQAVRAALDARDDLCLKLYESGLTMNEIATTAGISVATVSRRIKRAVAREE